MKKTLMAIVALTIVTLSCKSKKEASTAPAVDPMEAQLTALQTRMPAATMDELKKGHGIYYGACTNCHGAKNVNSFAEDRLQKTIDNMSAKAKLSDTDREAVWKYALAMNLAAKKQ